MTQIIRYILRGKQVVEATDPLEWAEWFEKADRRVALTEVGVPVWKCIIGKLLHLKRWEPIRISTVFLGLDYRFASGGPPILFETRVSGGELDQEMTRYSTWQGAEAGHEIMRQKVLRSTRLWRKA